MCLKTHRAELNGHETQQYSIYLGTSNEMLSGSCELMLGKHEKKKLIITHQQHWDPLRGDSVLRETCPVQVRKYRSIIQCIFLGMYIKNIETQNRIKCRAGLLGLSGKRREVVYPSQQKEG